MAAYSLIFRIPLLDQTISQTQRPTLGNKQSVFPLSQISIGTRQLTFYHHSQAFVENLKWLYFF